MRRAIGLEELVEAGDKRLGSRGHGRGGTQVVALELMQGGGRQAVGHKLTWWRQELSVSVQTDMVGVGDEHRVEVGDERPGLKKHETSTRRDTETSVWAWLGWETSNQAQNDKGCGDVSDPTRNNAEGVRHEPLGSKSQRGPEASDRARNVMVGARYEPLG